jgi:hypothetical protein
MRSIIDPYTGVLRLSRVAIIAIIFVSVGLISSFNTGMAVNLTHTSSMPRLESQALAFFVFVPHVIGTFIGGNCE